MRGLVVQQCSSMGRTRALYRIIKLSIVNSWKVFFIIPNLLLALLKIIPKCSSNIKLSLNIIPKSFIVRLAEISFSSILYSILGLFLPKCKILDLSVLKGSNHSLDQSTSLFKSFLRIGVILYQKPLKNPNKYSQNRNAIPYM